MIKTYCDKCKVELKNGEPPVHLDINSNAFGISMNVDLCVVCYEYIKQNWFKEAAGVRSEE